MSRRMVAAFLAIVVLPLVAVGWLGLRYAREEEAALRARLREAAEETLRGFGREIAAEVERSRPDLSALDATVEAERWRELSAGDPRVRHFFVFDPDAGELVHPSARAGVTSAEAAFLRRTRDIWASGSLAARPEGRSSETVDGGSGWQVWYHGQGLNLLWWETSGARIIGAELDSMALLARIIALLPETDARDPALPHSRIRLLDTNGRVLYQWGDHEADPDEVPLARVDVPAPLSAWKLDYLGAVPAAPAAAGLAPWLLALAVAVVGLAVYFYRESSRGLREAGQRVSFVNQVSHELKTPLTNIRMYAELLEDDLAEQPRSQHFAGIIVSESQRLARLIQNLLSFNRMQRNELKLRSVPGVVDETVRRTLERFAPAFEVAEIRVEAQLAAPRRVMLDSDVVEQVLGNLLNNVEKYAGRGSSVSVTTRQEEEVVALTVADDGAGVPAREAERIFEPFYRIGSRLNEGVTGTGIGLSIARDLARAHGGDLRSIEVSEGASFELTLHCPPVAEEAPCAS